jgi:hypothetical protein
VGNDILALTTKFTLFHLMMVHVPLFLALLIAAPNPTTSFAAWLKCSRDLEVDEVIMNNVVDAAPVDGDGVKLAVYDATGTRVDVDSVVWIDEGSPTSQSFDIKIDPDTSKSLGDIQFVVETYPFDHGGVLNSSLIPTASNHNVQSYPTVPSSAPKTPTPVSPAPVSPAPASSNEYLHKGATYTSFVGASSGGGVLCDGKRAHARSKSGYVKYELLVANPNDGKSDVISEIWAGWSQNHGAVTLTPRIQFKRSKEQVGEQSLSKEEL